MTDLSPATTALPALLRDRVALVTGAANGLGATIAATLAAAGARGVALDREPVAEPPADWLGLAADVTDPAALRAALTTTVERFGRLDVVVANAGVVPPWRATAELDAAEWDRVSSVNVRGVADTIAAAAPALAKAARTPLPGAAAALVRAGERGAPTPPRGGASVIAIASINARKAHPRQALYSATKHAVVGVVRATALDLGADGIRVNAVAPGAIATDALLGRMARRAAAGGLAADDALAAAAQETALGRIATAEEVAQTVLFLASDLASGVTGQVIPVDAGIA
ncbi:SDR family oxidoreductase [Conexibacter sp. JD483]|uniref:SDR family NAD(P)-dependent oxidoreductase n=1 Tax=unclassified Conexibacter TaxID=2627773 RepID=UPI002721407F|nr:MULTISPECIES: SDR family oxidoreductase [unclassified Conexibacter]MDO8185262.1 SDR family oxidoreductase [Conexibacter sp. CPCC 205706]MDO8198308.1 SDR family oxidoreductase [Conexibacter sp. CPCC 205762]MDR9367731.1 SDR family oxidoreductase [Conexibacter sp. JD483]